MVVKYVVMVLRTHPFGNQVKQHDPDRKAQAVQIETKNKAYIIVPAPIATESN